MWNLRVLFWQRRRSEQLPRDFGSLIQFPQISTRTGWPVRCVCACLTRSRQVNEHEQRHRQGNYDDIYEYTVLRTSWRWTAEETKVQRTAMRSITIFNWNWMGCWKHIFLFSAMVWPWPVLAPHQINSIEIGAHANVLASLASQHVGFFFCCCCCWVNWILNSVRSRGIEM